MILSLQSNANTCYFGNSYTVYEDVILNISVLVWHCKRGDMFHNKQIER